jgi:hypothetical protein
MLPCLIPHSRFELPFVISLSACLVSAAAAAVVVFDWFLHGLVLIASSTWDEISITAFKSRLLLLLLLLLPPPSNNLPHVDGPGPQLGLRPPELKVHCPVPFSGRSSVDRGSIRTLLLQSFLPFDFFALFTRPASLKRAAASIPCSSMIYSSAASLILRCCSSCKLWALFTL